MSLGGRGSSRERRVGLVRLSGPAPAATDGSYVVRRGDTLGSIARAQGVSGGWQALVAENPALSANPDLISVGQRLTL